MSKGYPHKQKFNITAIRHSKKKNSWWKKFKKHEVAG